jgi:hypothetical protein
MRELEDELVHYTVNAHRSAYKLQLGVVGIVVDEIMLVEPCQFLTADSAGHLSEEVSVSLDCSKNKDLEEPGGGRCNHSKTRI